MSQAGVARFDGCAHARFPSSRRTGSPARSGWWRSRTAKRSTKRSRAGARPSGADRGERSGPRARAAEMRLDRARSFGRLRRRRAYLCGVRGGADLPHRPAVVLFPDPMDGSKRPLAPSDGPRPSRRGFGGAPRRHGRKKLHEEPLRRWTGKDRCQAARRIRRAGGGRRRKEDDERVVSEAADVLFHAMVALRSRGLTIEAVLAELERRAGTSGHDEKAARTKSVV